MHDEHNEKMCEEPSLIKNFAVRTKKAELFRCSLSARQKLTDKTVPTVLCVCLELWTVMSYIRDFFMNYDHNLYSEFYTRMDFRTGRLQ